MSRRESARSRGRRHPPRTPRPAGTLRRSLLGLVLVPVVGLLGLTGYTVDDQAARADAAGRAAQDVRDAVALDAVRAAVAQEVVPVLGRAVLTYPSTARSVGVDSSSLAAISSFAVPTLDGQMSSAQAVTDDAIDATAGTDVAGRATTAERTVHRLRAASTEGDLSAVFDGYQALVEELSVQVGTLLQDARAEGLDSSGTRVLDDLQRLSRASSLASVEVPLYMSSLSTDGERAAANRAAFLSAWGSYVEAAREVTALGSPGVADRWRAAVTTADAATVDALMRGAAVDGTVLSLPQFVGLTSASTARDTAIRTVVAATAAEAVTAAGEPAERARWMLWVLVAVCSLLVLGSIAAAVLLRRWIARPLWRLAEQARAVSDGDLLDVEESGPAEVRTVARGLAVAVDNLRRVRDQAQAVADGALDAEVVRNPVHGPLGVVVHASVRRMVHALHERERLQEVLAHQASHDALTELPNRAQAQVLIDSSLRRMAGHHCRVGLLFVDLDHFKSVNDTHGHAAGDELLQVTSARMASCLRGGDVVARLGGDEFVVLVEHAHDGDALVDLGTRIIDAVSAPVDLTGRHTGVQVRVGASVGVAISPVGGGSAERLLVEADVAAYRAKAAGRGCVEVFDDALRQDLARRAALEDALRRGLRDGELTLHYQPVLDLARSVVSGVEALLRWRRPGHGLVEPDAFIPVAEASDLVCDLGRWALTEALSQLARWDTEGGQLAGIGVAVNVSPRHLAQPRLLGDVAGALAATGIAPERLTLEITETVLLDEPSAQDHLTGLRALGVLVALDDFGTGYTSIGQLSRLPVDLLKIDRSFVASGDRAHADLVRLIIGAAHSFSLGVVAEGVEEDRQLDALLAARCDAAQGFLFARPVPAVELGRISGLFAGAARN